MKRISILTALLFCSVLSQAQQWVSTQFTFETKVRQYKTYHQSAGQQNMKVVLMLHGLGGTMNDVDLTNWKAIADTANLLLVSPQALDYSIPLAGSLGPTWNSGIVLTNTPLGDITLNPTVNDVGFLNALIDTIQQHYAIDASRIFVTGFSNGGFMTQRLACESPQKFRAAASHSGTKALPLATCSNAKTLPIAHFHGTTDATVSWNGAFTSGGLTAQAGISVDSLVRYWQLRNNTLMVDSATIGSSANAQYITHYTYKTAAGSDKVELFKIHNGTHTWYNYNTTNNSFDLANETWKFFNKQGASPVSLNEGLTAYRNIKLFPNPATENIHIEVEGKDHTRYMITDLTGRIIKEQTFRRDISISALPKGVFILKIFDKNGLNAVSKFVKQ
ncbi:T9SS type A sorting domain-containing protein [Taibaiella sp. KBW10]|uniref:T9SS type A sorting domain-containing protein n=1 Tax=Taibaiella sp. KBW10 TaxID=2153357 RepID=UPI0013153BF1|nr:T9SS type A sorting domain-containing protein [Taibaiella sp. KBW10]